MPSAHARARRPGQPGHLDPRAPLVFDTRGLPAGSMRTREATVPAPADLGAGLVRVPEGSPLELSLQFEGVSEGVLVTAELTAALAGECARCLAGFTSAVTVSFQELFSYDAQAAQADGYAMDGDLLDIEPVLRDTLVPELPLSPLCAPDCPGLCAQCGTRLADAGPEHGHDDDHGGIWAALADFPFAAGQAPQDAGPPPVGPQEAPPDTQ